MTTSLNRKNVELAIIIGLLLLTSFLFFHNVTTAKNKSTYLASTFDLLLLGTITFTMLNTKSYTTPINYRLIAINFMLFLMAAIFIVSTVTGLHMSFSPDVAKFTLISAKPILYVFFMIVIIALSKEKKLSARARSAIIYSIILILLYYIVLAAVKSDRRYIFLLKEQNFELQLIIPLIYAFICVSRSKSQKFLKLCNILFAVIPGSRSIFLAAVWTHYRTSKSSVGQLISLVIISSAALTLLMLRPEALSVDRLLFIKSAANDFASREFLNSMFGNFGIRPYFI